MQGLHGFAMHGLCRGLDGLHVLQSVLSMLLVRQWCPDSQLADAAGTCKYRKAANMFAKFDAVLEELLDDDDTVLRMKAEEVTEALRLIKHKLLPSNI